MINLKKPNNTKIVITIGPASDSPELISALIDAGVDVFRINTSHGSIKKHQQTIKLIKNISKEKKCNTAILIDLQGPKIRIGELKNSIFLQDGQELILTTDDVVDGKNIPVDYKDIVKDVKPNDDIFINDGKLKLKALWVNKKQIGCTVINGGMLSSRKGINLPGSEVSTPAITERDKQFIAFAVKNDISYIALSFVRSEKDIIDAKKIIQSYGKNIPVIAKIEKPQAVQRINEIIQEADGIMVARGDLGIELSLEKVPLVQKMIVQKTNLANKPAIIATQMLESMVNDPIPTRAEANDVANSILDGTDAIMLSAETSVGKFPIQAVSIMERIAEEIEKSDLYKESLKPIIEHNSTRSINMNHDIAISNLCNDLNIKAVIAITDSGYTARILSKARIKFPIIALTDQLTLCKELNLLWGIVPIFFNIKSIDFKEKSLEKISNTIIEQTFLNKGDSVLFIAGLPYLDSEKITKTKKHTL